jgi:hypothetical protein
MAVLLGKKIFNITELVSISKGLISLVGQVDLEEFDSK